MGLSRLKRQVWRLTHSLVNRVGGMTTPRRTVDIDDRNLPTSFAKVFSRSSWEVPAGRSVAGNLAAVEAVLAAVTSESARARYRRRLAGSVVATREDIVVCMEGGRLAHTDGLVVTPDDRVLLGGSGVTLDSPQATNPLQLSHMPRPQSVHGTVAVLACFATTNYYHWMTSALPRLRLYEAAGITADAFYTPYSQSFHRDALRLMGITPTRILAAKPQRHLVADRLAVSTWQSLRISPEDCDALHRRLTSHLPADRAATSRLLIMRHRPGRRSIVNQQELLRALQPLGFEPICLERLPLTTQIERFHGAECVVGAHGAGLTNLLFCRPGTIAVEIGTPYRVLPCFAEIAHHRGLRHHLELAQPVNVRHFDPIEGVGDSDILVEPTTIRRRLEMLLADVPAGRRLSA